MQTNTKQAVEAINKVTEIIDQINTISQTIATAIEEQSITMTDIARNVNEVNSLATNIANTVSQSAENLSFVSNNMGSMNDSVHQTSDGIVQIDSKAAELKTLSKELHTVVDQFKI